MRARSTRRRLASRLPLAAAVATLLVTGVVALPARGDPRPVVRDKVQALVAGRAETGLLRTAETAEETELVGFEWQGSQAGALELRTKGRAGWSAWQQIEGDPAEGPDPGSPERRAVTTAGPVWVARGTTQVQVRVVEGSLPGLKLHALHSGTPAGGAGGTKPAGAATPPRPGIVSRAGWGADESRRSLNAGCGQPSYADNVRFSVVHHTAGANAYTPADSASIVRAIYHFHTHTNHWCDIGYNLLVDRFGTVFEGRFGGVAQAVIGAHAEGFNTGSTGVAVLGTFSTEPVPAAAYGAVRDLLAWKLAVHGVDPQATISTGGIAVRTITGHRDVNATDCPGNRFEELLPQLRTDVAALILGPGSRYHPQAPARVLDTRLGIGLPGRLGPGGTMDLKVTGVGGVPASGVTAVALNVTATNASGPLSYLTVWPKASPRPNASNLNFTAGVPVPNLVVGRVGADGSVSIYNSTGLVDVAADVQGWYSDSAAGGSTYVALDPARVLDTRTGIGTGGTIAPTGPGGVIQLPVTGVAGVPATGVTAVVLNMTVDRPTGPESYLTVWPSGSARPTASNLNFTAGPAATNLVVAQVGVDGKVAIYNDAGSTHVIADVQGWYAAPAVPPPGSSYSGVTPARVLDTRLDIGGAGPLGPGGTIDLTVAGVGGVPATGVRSVVLNMTVTDPSGPESYLTVFPAGTAGPLASNLNFVAGETVANLVVVRVQGGKVSILNHLGSTHVIADVQGWFSGGP